MDSISTLAVLVGAIIIKYTDFYLLDAIIGLGVSALIIIAGAKILIETKNAILGEAPVDELIDSIKEIVNTYPEIIGMHDLLVHNYGPKSFIASFHAEVDGSKDIYMLHDVIDNAEREIKEKLNIACTIHLDPISTDDETVNKYREMILETIRELSFGYQIHDFRVVVGNTHTNLIFDIVIPFEEKLPEQKIKEMISENIKIKQNDLYCVITVDRG